MKTIHTFVATTLLKAAMACTASLLMSAYSGEAFAQTNVSVSANIQRSIGGVGNLDRAKYFNYSGTLQAPSVTNLGNLRREAWLPSGLNASTGRVATELDQFIAQNLPEDPNKPGYFDHSAVINKIQGDYRNFVLSGSRWEGLRNSPNPIFVQSGRNGGFWPNYLDSGGLMPTNYEAYADFLNVYFEEAVYGTGPNQGFLPIDPNRFFFEVMNEPNWSTPSQAEWNEVIEMHQVVTEQVKEVFPQLKIGGPSCCDDLGSGTNGWDRARQMMDDMASWQTPSGDSVELDFWVIHPYERYDVATNGTHSRAVDGSPGHVSGIMDLYESYSHQKFGDPKAFAVTEYGSFNRTNMADGSYGDYARPEQQWDLVRDIREKMFVFMDRPDRIINATPFVSPRHWQNAVPTNAAGDNVFWEQDSSGNWNETIVASLFRMFNDVSGKYVDVASDNPDFQTVAFRDGNQLYIMLNNLETTSSTLNLQALAGSSNVTSASLDRIFWNGSARVYESGLDVSGSWQNLTLDAAEGAVLTLTLEGPELYDLVTDESTYYGDAVELGIDSLGKSQIVNIAADTEDAVLSTARVTFNRGSNALGESFFVIVNDNFLQVPAGELEFDDDDNNLITREVEVPLSALVDGNNEVYVDFVGAGGELVAAVLTVTRSLGDFNGSGAFDGEDLSLLVDEFGPAAADSKFDLSTDGVVDMADVDYWLTQLRGTTVGLGDFDLDDDIDLDDLALLRAGIGSNSHYGLGDLDFDGDTDGADFLKWQQLSGNALSTVSAIPEPASILLAVLGIAAFSTRQCQVNCSKL